VFSQTGWRILICLSNQDGPWQAIKLLLPQSAVRYIGIEVDDAIEIAEKIGANRAWISPLLCSVVAMAGWLKASLAPLS
jgi:hypothetical protein